MEVDCRDEKLSYKMRESQTRKIPYTLILGDKEKNDNVVSYRLHGSKETNTMDIKKFLSFIKKQIKQYK